MATTLRLYLAPSGEVVTREGLQHYLERAAAKRQGEQAVGIGRLADEIRESVAKPAKVRVGEFVRVEAPGGRSMRGEVDEIILAPGRPVRVTVWLAEQERAVAEWTGTRWVKVPSQKKARR